MLTKVKETLIEDLSKSVVEGDAEKAVKISQEAIAVNVDAYELMQEGLMKGMKEVGNLFKRKEYYLPEVLMSAEAMHESMKILKPLVKKDARLSGVVVIGTVAGDIHDIGKNIVATMLESVGFNVIDLGTDVGLQGFLESVKRDKPDIVALSSLMTTTMENMKTIISGLREAGYKARIIIGGAPLNQEIASEYGADGYAPDALVAQKLAIELMQKKVRPDHSSN
jgi:corrinoid protein of di/trimethylamine methyltransferase